MPKSIKKKVVDRKKGRDDEVTSYAYETIDKIKKKQKQVITVGVILAAVLALYMTFTMYSATRKADAVAVEMKANNYYYNEIADDGMTDEERLNRALELYRESVDKAVTLSALYNLGNTYYKLGEYDNALKEYERFLDTFGGNDELVPLVYQKMAASYVRMGQYDKAFAVLEKLAGVNGGIFRDTALVLEARYLESIGKTGKSLEKYRELALDYPNSVWSGEAASKLQAPDTEGAGYEDKPEEENMEEPAKGEE